MLFSSLLGFAVAAGYWGSSVVENPWGCAAVVVIIGLVQPQAVWVLNFLLKLKGIDLELDGK